MFELPSPHHRVTCGFRLGFLAVGGSSPCSAGRRKVRAFWHWKLRLASAPMYRVSVVASNALPIQASP
jgi:hypothetical protein